jgi:ribosomal-protein-alanine N-acetyltransferase
MHPEIPAAIFEEFPLLRTPRLLLRPITLADAAEIYALRSNDRVSAFIARPPMPDPTEAERLVERVQQAYAQRQAISWAGELRDGGTLIGACGYNSIDHPNRHAEIGGELGTAYWGKGIAQEAFLAILQFGLGPMHLHTIEAKVSPANRSAIHLLEQYGFQKEAHFQDRIYHQGKYSDMAVYTLLDGMQTW